MDRTQAAAILPGVPARSGDADARPHTSDGVDEHAIEPVALDGNHRVGLKRAARSEGTTEVADPLLADRERDCAGREPFPFEQVGDHVRDERHGRCVVADARADKPVAVARERKRCVSGEDRVDVCQQEELRPPLAPDPEQVANVVARSSDDVDKFMENLEATGAFAELGRRIDEHLNDQGLLETTIEMIYTPSGTTPPAARRTGAAKR